MAVGHEFEPSGPPQPQGGGAAPHDLELVRACLAASPGAWDALVGRYAGLLAHVVDRTASQRRRPLTSADRDDLIAEVLVELLKNDAAALRGFAGRSTLAAYLTVIARRVVVRSLCRDAQAARPAGGAEPSAARNDHRDIADREEIEVMLGRLDEAEAQLVRLHHLESRSYGEISRITGLPIGSIGPALSRARQKMRDGAAAAG
jgi:RNA polymerase sigma-70 factor (ECF subfamily)